VRLREVAGMRFLWGMRPLGAAGELGEFRPPPRGPSRVELSVIRGGTIVARASLSRRVTPSSVRMRKLTVRRDGVYGFEFTPREPRPHPAVLVFGGSEGGDSMVDAAGLLAAHGYTTLALAYFREPGLPYDLVNIPLEYFARALRLLRRQPHVDPRRVVTMGVSRGGEASLLVASTFPRLVHGAIGLVPSSLVYGAPDRRQPAWRYRGRPLKPMTPIPVERIAGPVLTAGGGLDVVWDSNFYVHEIGVRLREAHFRFPHTELIYPHAGHFLGTAYPYVAGPLDQDDFGGSARADAAAKADLWPRILRFLARLSPPRG
jgi:dienelactone hydrolase